MNKDKITIVTFLFLLLLTASCANLENIVVGDVSDVKFRGFVDNTLAFNVVVPVENPSNVRFKIKEVNVKATVNGEYIGRILSDDVVVIPPRSDDEHVFLIKIHLLRGASTVMHASRNKSMEVEVDGYIKAKSYLMNRKIPVYEKRIISGI